MNDTNLKDGLKGLHPEVRNDSRLTPREKDDICASIIVLLIYLTHRIDDQANNQAQIGAAQSSWTAPADTDLARNGWVNS